MPLNMFRKRKTFGVSALVAFSSLTGGVPAGLEGSDLLPDLILRELELLDHDVVTDGHRVLLRLATATANVGTGPVRVIGVEPGGSSGDALVMQVVFREDGSHYERPAGSFEFHPTHHHVHLEDWAIYRLRAHLEGGAVGEVVAQGAKTSFCLLDSLVHDANLPGVPTSPVYRDCGDEAQGISAGWADYYHRQLYGQNIDVGGLPQGSYWLEVEVDPEDHILEENEANNLTRILVEIGEPEFISGPLEVSPPDVFHPPGQVDLRVGFRPDRRYYRGDNSYFPAPQELKLGGTERRTLAFISDVENEDHHSRQITTSIFRLDSNVRRWSHFQIGGEFSGNITASILGSGHDLRLGVGATATFRSVGKLSKTRRHAKKGPKAKPVRLILQVAGNVLFDQAHVVITD